MSSAGRKVRQDVLFEFRYDLRDWPPAVFEIDHQLVNAQVLLDIEEL